MLRDQAEPVSPAFLRAVTAASETAKWEGLDLVARKGRHVAPDLLRGRSAELAFSPCGFDQLLSLALDQAALAIEEGALFFAVDLTPLLRPITLPVERERLVREAAAKLGGVAGARREKPAASRAWAAGSGRDHADLCRLLWREARIPADDGIRAAMLALASARPDRSDRRRLRLLRGR